MLDPYCCTHWRLTNDTITINRNPPRNQDIRNINVAHDLMKASTTHNHPSQPPTSTMKKRHKEASAVPLATLSKKWPRCQLDHPFQIPSIALDDTCYYFYPNTQQLITYRNHGCLWPKSTNFLLVTRWIWLPSVLILFGCIDPCPIY